MGSSLRSLLVFSSSLWSVWASVVAAPRLWSTGSVGVQGLSCSQACGVFSDQGLNGCLLAL